MTDTSATATRWAGSNDEPDSVLELSNDQIDAADAAGAADVLSLDIGMEIARPAVLNEHGSDPFVRIRNGQQHQPRPPREMREVPSEPQMMPRVPNAHWGTMHFEQLAELEDALKAARRHANFAKTSHERTKAVLYRAISSAYDLALTVRDAPGYYDQLLERSGISAQPRAPMTPIIKLVFGSDYDKTRIAEYAAVLAHAARHNVARGELETLLGSAQGGIKSIVAFERRERPAMLGHDRTAHNGLSDRSLRRLRQMPLTDISGIPAEGQEFALVMIRRTTANGIEIIGEVPDNPKLMKSAVKAVLPS
ncbi:hypothetical protein [Novosphingobium sp.]|uniref:hypothetical protein n=1 Tax=Novosphingobium sp. TaxID=1874826 RepID=UPI0025FEE90E|nr:hypothetical protein [Novosphingobium sp.]